jgi:two-component system, cell cycle sensor histidine kinase and response regulator CckA
MALLLACALYTLDRVYPRAYLRFWSAASLAASLSIGLSAAGDFLRPSGPGELSGVASRPGTDVPGALAWWASQWCGVLGSALFVLGAWSLHQARVIPRRLLLLISVGAAGLALLGSRLSPQHVGVSRADLLSSAGIVSVAWTLAALIGALLILRRKPQAAELGAKWMSSVLGLIALLHLSLLVFHATPASASSVSSGILQLAPVLDVVLMSALGIGTVIVLLEQEKASIRLTAERQLEAERRARTSGATLVSALAAVPDLVAVVGLDATVLSWNPAFDAFARAHSGLIPTVGMPLTSLLPVAETADWHARIAALLRGEDQAFEFTFDRADAQTEHYDFSARPMHDAGELVGGVIVARDVTERRKLEQQLQQAQRLDTVGRLAGGIAHDFNNLLTAILSSASMARDTLPADHEVQADLADVQLAGERATQLTKQLLAFARRQPVSQQPIELNDRVATMERMLSRLVGPDVDLQVSLADALWYVRADGPQLEQVLVNVAVNARDAMPTGGRLTIRTANRNLADGAVLLPRPMPAGDYVEIVVTDTGVGMDAETLAHVFEPFYTTKAVGQGTGLGLAMCYGIIRQHHGVIWIDSAPGRGSSVHILLPRFDGELPARGERKKSDTPVSSSGTETVLLVEDEPQVRAVAARALRSAGYRVLEATNGRDGLQVARRERDGIDLIVSDVVMPEMGGKEMVELARQFLPKAAVLFVSGYTAGSFPTPSEDPSANVFLQKPFSPQELLVMVRSVLDRRAASQSVREAAPAP